MSFNIGELEGSGGASWAPKEIGDKIKGTIVKIERLQQTSFDSGTPLEWADGSPRMQTVVTLQTELSENSDDDGVRSVWLKGGKNFEIAEGEGKSGELALAQAAKDAGVSSIDEHGKLSFLFSGRAKPTTRGYQPARMFVAQYEAPVASISANDLWDD